MTGMGQSSKAWRSTSASSRFVEYLEDPARQVVGVARVDVAVEVEVGEEELPVLAHPGEDAIPVEVPPRREDQVQHAAHIVAVPPGGHEDLREEHLIGGDHEHLPAEHRDLLRALEPGYSHGYGAAVVGVDDVREEPSLPRLG
jgi:hypothetical protein